jgi:pimeloyl-ACP methyl ester carboxylesterase
MTVQHRTVDTNGIRMHVVEQGSGPLVVLCHGFPELWYSWRHQLPALAAAGFRAVAPDQRGYGGTDRPDDVGAYTILHCAGDIVGLVQALGEREAVIVGHDWGAPVAWTCALVRPDIFRAVALLSVPYRPRGDLRPTEGMRQFAGEQQFYQEYFQPPGVAEAEFEADVRSNLLKFMWSNSGDAPRDRRWHFLFPKDAGCLDSAGQPDSLPPWLTADDLDVFATAFARSGFRGGLSWYRNADRSWELTAFLRGATIRQPSLFVAGAEDQGIVMVREGYEQLETVMPGLTRKVLLPDAGHWIQQERPEAVSALLIEFLNGLA